MHQVLKAHCETGHFSHGYLLAGEKENSRASCREVAALLLNCPEPRLNSHPDFLQQFFSFFGPEESQTLRQKFSMKPILAEKRVFLLEIDSFDHKAIGGLAKILEDPPATCHFFFIADFPEDIPLVLRSRLVNLFEGTDFILNGEKKNFYEKFLKEGPVERLSLAKDAAGDKRIALEFINELEVVLREKIKKERPAPDIFKNILSSLEELKTDRQFLYDRAPSPRMIIEHFALTLPQLK